MSFGGEIDNQLYFDANASYGPVTGIAELISSWYLKSSNPNSIHQSGQKLWAAIEESRATIREALKAPQDATVVFTSGASEANNQLLFSFEERLRKNEPVSILSTAIEHPCVRLPLLRLKQLGAEVTLIAPNENGSIDINKFLSALTQKTSLVSVMAANNETGVLMPLKEISVELRRIAPSAIFHSDIAQFLGKGECTFESTGVDVVSVAGHKFGAPAGIGALVSLKHVSFSPFIVGGTQELKLRAGTQNSIGIVAMGEALKLAISTLKDRESAMRIARDRFEVELTKKLPFVTVNCSDSPRLPNTSSLWVKGVRAADLIVALDLEGVCVSAGAACSSGKQDLSQTLLAHGFSEDRVRETLRVSFRHDVTVKDILRGVDIFTRCIERFNK